MRKTCVVGKARKRQGYQKNTYMSHQVQVHIGYIAVSENKQGGVFFQ